MPPVRGRVWVRVSFGVGGQLSPEAIVLEPQKPLGKIKKKVNKKRLTKKVLKDTLKAYFW